MGAHFQKAITGIGVVDPGPDDDFELAVVAGEMPFDGTAEIALPDVEHEPDRAEDMRFREFERALGNGVEMALVVRTDRAMDRSAERRQIKLRRAERPRIDAVGIALVDREDETHPIVSRPRPDRPGRAGNADRFRRPFWMYVRRLWEKPEPDAAPAALPVHVPSAAEERP